MWNVNLIHIILSMMLYLLLTSVCSQGPRLTQICWLTPPTIKTILISKFAFSKHFYIKVHCIYRSFHVFHHALKKVGGGDTAFVQTCSANQEAEQQQGAQQCLVHVKKVAAHTANQQQSPLDTASSSSFFVRLKVQGVCIYCCWFRISEIIFIKSSAGCVEKSVHHVGGFWEAAHDRSRKSHCCSHERWRCTR